jgi:ferredoxin
MSKNYKVLYFSGTGNTEYVVKELQRALLGAGNDCSIMPADKLWSICGRSPHHQGDKERVERELCYYLESTDCLIVAFGVYASLIPRPLFDLIKLLPERQMQLASVCTCAKTGGDACRLPLRLLKDKGYEGVLAAQVKMPNNIKIPPLNFFKIENGKTLDKFYESSKKKINFLAGKLSEQRKYFEGGGLISLLLGVFQRNGETFMKRYFSTSFYASRDCIKCLHCINSCPQGNIILENGKIKFANNCCFCLRCYSFCPANAIQLTEKTEDIKKYPRYKGFNNYKPQKLYDYKVNNKS